MSFCPSTSSNNQPLFPGSLPSLPLPLSWLSSRASLAVCPDLSPDLTGIRIASQVLRVCRCNRIFFFFAACLRMGGGFLSPDLLYAKDSASVARCPIYHESKINALRTMFAILSLLLKSTSNLALSSDQTLRPVIDPTTILLSLTRDSQFPLPPVTPGIILTRFLFFF